jgi:predicted transcriptional regulator
VEIRRFDLDAQGLARVLGELEAKILEAVWSLQQPTVRDVTDWLGPGAHVKTTMTVMNRMVEKGLLHRERHGRAFCYEPVAERESFMAQIAARVLASLMTDFPRPTVAYFLDTANAEQLAELEDLLRSRRHD